MPGRLRVDEIASATNTAVKAPSGIKFSNANSGEYGVLDWYEEGTFTPAVSGVTTAGVGTYIAGSTFGGFVRIGNVVTLSMRLEWSAHTGTGPLLIPGLPYYPTLGGQPAGSLSNNIGAVPVGMKSVAGGVWLHGNGQVFVNSAGTWTNVSLASSGGIIISGSYIAG